MATTRINAAAGAVVAFWDVNGQLGQARVLELSDDGSFAKLQTLVGDFEASYVPRFGRRDNERRWCFDEVDYEGFDPDASEATKLIAAVKAIDKPILANPIASIRAWCASVTTPLRMAEALCIEEQAEVMENFYVHDGEVRDENQKHFTEALHEYSRILRSFTELMVDSDDLNKLVDGHLDSAWVHLLAAAQIVGTENLAEAWSRLHRANIDGKQVDGAFILDETGKVTKPQGWQAPTYNDLIKQEII